MVQQTSHIQNPHPGKYMNVEVFLGQASLQMLITIHLQIFLFHYLAPYY